MAGPALEEDDPNSAHTRFGERAVARGYVDAVMLDECLREHEMMRARGSPVALGQVMLRRGALKTAQYIELLRDQDASRRVCTACGKRWRTPAPPPNDFPPCPKCGASLARRETRMLPAVTASAAPRLGKYEIVAELGRGGMGIVYLARDPQLNREVALKLLRDEEFAGPETLKRFAHEAKNAAKLRHPNIVAVHEWGEADGHHFFVMDVVRGRPFDALVHGPKDERDTAIAVLADVARALHFAHGQGVVHRDVKPGNVIVDDHGRPVILDFGLSKSLTSTSVHTRTGAAMGTPAYMAPEQVRGGRVEPRTDVYGLGVILYEILTRRVPFTSTSLADIYDRIAREEPTAPRLRDRAVPPDLEAVCLKAMEKDPQHRYETALAFAEDLDRFRAGQPVLATHLSGMHRMARRASRHVWLIAGAAVALVAALAVGLYVLRLHREAVARTQAEERRRDADRPYQRALQVLQQAEAASGDELKLLFEQARDGFAEAIALDPSFAAAWRERARARGALGDLDGADSDFQQAITLAPSDPLVYFRRALMWMRAYRERRPLPRVFVMLNGYFVDPRKAEDVGTGALRTRANDDLEKAAKLFEESGGGWEERFGAGLLHLLADRYVPAVEALDESLRRFPANPEALYHRGLARLFRQEPQPGPAADDLDRAHRMGLQSFEALVHGGLAHFAVKKPDHTTTAIARFDAAAGLRPKDTMVPYYRGLALVQLSDDMFDGLTQGDVVDVLRRAVADFTANLAASDNELETLLARARAYASLGHALRETDRKAAREAYDAGLKDADASAPDDSTWTHGLTERGNRWGDWAYFLEFCGEDSEPAWDESERIFQLVTERKPDDQYAWVQLAHRLLKRGQRCEKKDLPVTPWVERAIALADKCLQANAYVNSAVNYRLDAYVLWLDYEDRRGAIPEDLVRRALEAGDDSVKRKPDDAEMLVQRGTIRMRAGWQTDRSKGDPKPLWLAAIADWEESARRVESNRERVAGPIEQLKKALEERKKQ